MIACDVLPFNFVSHVGFVRLIHELEPRYTIPAPETFSRSLIPEMYTAVKNKVQILVDKAHSVSITSDVWTSTNNLNAFLSLTAHWIDEDWNRMFVVLSLRNLEDRHTGQLIATSLINMLDGWSIPIERRGVLVRDNGASMVKAAQLSELQDLGCYIHTIQLVVKLGLKSQRAVIDAVNTARALVGRFRHSTQSTEQLLKIQKTLN